MRWPLVVSLWTTLAAGCSSPPPGAPLEVAAIAGRWRADGVRLDIGANGTIDYHRSVGGDFTLNGVSVSNVSTTGFDAGAFGITTHFVLNAPPTTVDGRTTMTVDGRVLQKLGADEGDAVAPLVVAPTPTTLPAAGTLAALVGRWEGSANGVSISLRIEPDGTLHYRKEHGDSHTALKGVTVQDITPTSFAAGAFGVTTTFRVDAAPAVVDGVVRMTIDGIPLTKMTMPE